MDSGHEQTDKKLKTLENRLTREYKGALKTVKERTNKYLKKFREKDKEQKTFMMAGLISKKEYAEWRAKAMMYGNAWEDLKKVLAEDLVHVDQIAMSITNGFLPEVYADNFNFGTYEIESGASVNTSFTLYDKQTVENLMKKDPQVIPKPSIKVPKDKRWSKSKITSALTQGILAGDSINHIADRLQKVTDMSRNAAIRNARTYTTAAESKGRLDSYDRAVGMGIDVEKKWLATLDERTRTSHRLLDGETIKNSALFSNGLMYPGDPSGAPQEIYNCRCRLIADLKNLSLSEGERNSKLNGMSYEEWKYGNIQGQQKQLDDINSKLNNMSQNYYFDLWKDPVTLADYMTKKGGIEGKKKYFDDKIEEAQVNGWEEKEEKFKKYKKELEDFEKKGKEYEKLYLESQELQKKIDSMSPNKNPFSASAYSEARMNSAMRFTDAEDADKYHRPYLDSIWDKLSDREKYSVWEYTHNSNPMNQPLSGYNDGWSRGRFVGVGKANWGLQDNWRSVYSDEYIKKFSKDGSGNVDYYRTISDMTLAVDKTALPKDTWLVRGSDTNGFAGLLEGNIFSFDEAKKLLTEESVDDVKKALEGQVFQSHSFMSTGIAEGTGFTGDVSYKIYAPKGTHAIYAEPQSYFGMTINGEEIYKKGKRYTGIGGEAEVVIQRGTSYRVKEIKEKGWNGYEVTLEVVDQPKYFKVGSEETFNNGATLHPKM